MSPAEDEKLSTAEGRMEKDKMIQEMPEQEPEEKVQAKEEEEPVQMKSEEEEPVQMKAEEEEPVQMKSEEEEPVQMKAESGASASPQLSSRLQGAKGGGRPLSGKTRQQMETSIGADFNGVNIHTGADAVEMNKELHAQAFTHGKDVYFNAGKYNPDSSEGKRLLAHELTHVVQQSGPEVQAKHDPIGQKFSHKAGAKSPHKKITGHYDGQTFTLFGDGGELMSTPAQSGRPYTVTEEDAKKCGGNKDDSYMNNPLYVGIRENGPIPEGKFQFSASQMATFDSGDRLKLVTGKHKSFTDPFGNTMHGGDWGPGRVALNPVQIIDAPKGCGDTKKRSGFYLHGGILPGSSGCIDVGNGGLKEVMKHLDGYQGQITISVKYAGGAQKVGWFKRLMGRITYGNPEKKEH